MSDIALIVAELHLSGEVGLGTCSPSTVYRWTRKINEYLAREKADWRVKAITSECVICVEEY